ncbi:MAG: nucleoside transporter [Bifidobacteriaceae bacterium]|jgi:purine nucleoside transport protein|nr:nucleoside transporter [Bifidobacteriaceae bacterium]
MNIGFLILNILAIPAFAVGGWAASNNKKEALSKRNIKYLGIMTLVMIALAAFMVATPIGRDAVDAAAAGFTWMVNCSYKGVAFILASSVPASMGQEIGGTMPGDSMTFVISALMPILMVVPLFDILTYIGVLPFIIRWVGAAINFLTGKGKFESFYLIEMMFLGNTEALAVSRFQVKRLSTIRNVTIAMMSMSCITASILGAYMKMMPGHYILTAVPLNIIAAAIVTSILNPVPKLSEKEDFVVKVDEDENGKKIKKPPFFIYLGDSILTGGRLILIIMANVCAFVALAFLADKLLGLTTLSWLTLENILGVFLTIPAFLLGFPIDQAFHMATLMGMKLVTNEFVVMGQIGTALQNVDSGQSTEYSQHFTAVLSVFLTSFANFSTIGMVTGVYKGLADEESNNAIARNVPRMFLSGVLVSLFAAAAVGLFVW